jgi:hypothetical protein
VQLGLVKIFASKQKEFERALLKTRPGSSTMSTKDTATRLRAQQASNQSAGQKRVGGTRYRMAAAQVPQDATKIAQELDAIARSEEISQRHGNQAMTAQPALQAPPMAFTQVDGQQSTSDEESPEDHVRGLWKSRVLSSYANDADHRASMCGRAAMGVSVHEQESAIKENMIGLIDQMFDVFQNCAYEMNKFATGTELELNWIRPFLSKEGIPTQHSTDNNLMVIFSGRMSTRRWTMVIKGTLEYIQFFILPADKLIGFALSTSNFRPFFMMEPACEGLNVSWHINRSPLRREMFPVIQRELFNGLIRHATGEIKENECFDLELLGLAPAPADTVVDQERQRYYQEAFIEDINASMNGTYQSKPIASRLHENIQAPPEAKENNSKDFNEPLPSHIKRELELLTQGANPMATDPRYSQNTSPDPSAPQAVQGPQGPQGPRTANINFSNASHVNMPDFQAAAAKIRLEQEKATRPVPSVANGAQVISSLGNAAGVIAPSQPPPQQQQQQQRPAPMAAPAPVATPTGPMNLPAALNILLMSIDKELEVVAKAGADAFNSKEFARADAALKFSARLSDYRKVSQELLDYYRRKR